MVPAPRHAIRCPNGCRTRRSPRYQGCRRDLDLRQGRRRLGGVPHLLARGRLHDGDLVPGPEGGLHQGQPGRPGPGRQHLAFHRRLPYPAQDEEILAQFPEGYRYLAYLQLQAGYPVKTDMPGLAGPEVERLYARGAAWLAADPVTQ